MKLNSNFFFNFLGVNGSENSGDPCPYVPQQTGNIFEMSPQSRGNAHGGMHHGRGGMRGGMKHNINMRGHPRGGGGNRGGPNSRGFPGGFRGSRGSGISGMLRGAGPPRGRGRF